MSLHALARWSLRVVLALCLVVSGMAVGAARNAGGSERAATVASSSSDTTPYMPCHGLAAVDHSENTACDCCPQRSCDSTSCAIVGCLPSLPQATASAAPAAPPILGALAAPPSMPIEPPLRPPIA